MQNDDLPEPLGSLTKQLKGCLNLRSPMDGRAVTRLSPWYLSYKYLNVYIGEVPHIPVEISFFWFQKTSFLFRLGFFAAMNGSWLLRCGDCGTVSGSNSATEIVFRLIYVVDGKGENYIMWSLEYFVAELIFLRWKNREWEEQGS